jgi:hypothetical protein
MQFMYGLRAGLLKPVMPDNRLLMIILCWALFLAGFSLLIFTPKPMKGRKPPRFGLYLLLLGILLMAVAGLIAIYLDITL